MLIDLNILLICGKRTKVFAQFVQQNRALKKKREKENNKRKEKKRKEKKRKKEKPAVLLI